MAKQKLDLDLIGEMTWSECVRATAEQLPVSERKTKAGKITREAVTTYTFVCGCGTSLSIPATDDLVSDAQAFLDQGWGYRRGDKSFDAVCPACRRTRRNK